MSRFLHPDYRTLEPYVPGEQPKERRFIKLNTNESPFPPSPKVQEVLSGGIANRLQMYSDPTLEQLTTAIAAHFGYRPEQVFAGNGSDDVLAFCIMGFCGRGGKLACPDITYGFYTVYASLFGAQLTQIPLREDFTVCADDYIGLNQTIVIANPNAPTGLALPVEEVERIVAGNPENIVIIDEAYADFSKVSCMELLERYPNLIVTQTFSKSRSLAGLRVGFCLAAEELIRDLNTLKFSFNPYNINSLSIAAAAAAIADRAYYDQNITRTVAIREDAKRQLAGLGFDVLDSQSNFLFVKHPAVSGRELFLKLRAAGILVRHFDKPRIAEYLRITVGSEQEMQTLTETLKAII